MAEEPNLSGRIQGLCRLDHVVFIVHTVSFGPEFHNLGPWGHCLLPLLPFDFGDINNSFGIRLLPASLVSHDHEHLDDDSHFHADSYFSHFSSISSAYFPGAVALGTLGFQPTVTFTQRAATRVLLRLSMTQRTQFGDYFGAIASGASLAFHKFALPSRSYGWLIEPLDRSPTRLAGDYSLLPRLYVR